MQRFSTSAPHVVIILLSGLRIMDAQFINLYPSNGMALEHQEVKSVLSLLINVHDPILAFPSMTNRGVEPID